MGKLCKLRKSKQSKALMEYAAALKECAAALQLSTLKIKILDLRE